MVGGIRPFSLTATACTLITLMSVNKYGCCRSMRMPSKSPLQQWGNAPLAPQGLFSSRIAGTRAENANLCVRMHDDIIHQKTNVTSWSKSHAQLHRFGVQNELVIMTVMIVTVQPDRRWLSCSGNDTMWHNYFGHFTGRADDQSGFEAGFSSSLKYRTFRMPRDTYI